MDATQVVIHFIGLVLFSTEVPNDPGLHAILPAIRHTVTHPEISKHPSHAAPETSLGTPAGFATEVEQHVALLIFHQDYYAASDSQWHAPTILSRFPHATRLAEYRYVELTGEHITFIVDAPGNRRATIPKNMPRFSCDGKPELTSGFQWPYRRAAAVVDIPEGALSVCKATRFASGRVDSRLVLNTAGTLTVVAMKSGEVKTLVLRTTDDATIYLANVPPPFVKGTTTIAGAPHFQAYLEMIAAGRTSACSGRPRVSPGMPPVPDCERGLALGRRGPAIPLRAGRFSRIRRFFRARAGVQVPVQQPSPLSAEEYRRVGAIFLANAECSNTQWP